MLKPLILMFLKAKPLTDEEINALEAFLKTLTDEAYEE